MRMKIPHEALIVLIAIAMFATGCATGSAAKVTQLPKTIDAACEFYRDGKPAVVQYVDWAKTNWDATNADGSPVIGAEQKELLSKLYSYLPKLDAIGGDICHIADALKAAESGGKFSIGAALKSVDVDDVLAVAMKVATTAAQLKAKGVF